MLGVCVILCATSLLFLMSGCERIAKQSDLDGTSEISALYCYGVCSHVVKDFEGETTKRIEYEDDSEKVDKR